MARSRSPFEGNPLGGILGFVAALVVLYVLLQLFGWFYALLWKVAPVMLIASLIIDSSVFKGYFSSIKSLFEKKWYYGLAAIVLSAVVFPLTASYMLGMSLFRKKMKKKAAEVDEQVNGKWADFEDVTEDTMDLDIPYEELPPAPPEPQPRGRSRKGDNEYDELFD